MARLVLSVFLFLLMIELRAQIQTYAEMYRPQFHVSPSSGFMGDPDGPLKYNGKYHLFWWGHLRSDDLVYWQELNKNALNGTPSGFGNWSGSVVVDVNNTSGLGTNGMAPMIATYTLNENATGIQTQGISYSLNYGSFNYYSGNPVINSTSHNFRDPQVFWYEATQKWILVVTKPVDRAIEIYSSPDLKSWIYESTFSDRGGKNDIWEVPDLFEVPLNGNITDKRWVMTCGMGPNRMQFWVGQFDGHQFILDAGDNLLTSKQVQGYVFADFETSLDGWTVEGNAFGATPDTSELSGQQVVYGFTGHGYVNSFHAGDASTGKLISQSFVIEQRYINFLIGGGNSTNTKLSVVVDGQELAYAGSTANQETLRWRGIDVSSAIGKTAHIEIVDNATGGWGHILVDHIVFSDILFDTRSENANWADWGTDFYAGKSFRNYDNDDSRNIWLAWMGNWAYAKNVPTKPWQGFESIPRELYLVNDSHGYQLLQKPIAELTKLRLDESVKNDFTIAGMQSIGFNPAWNVYEIKAKFKVDRFDQVFGFNLAEGNGQKLVVSYDAKTANLSVTRPVTHFSYNGFTRISKAPITLPADSTLDLHIFVDQSSIEIFANNYTTTLSMLSFTNVNETGITLFSNAGDVNVVELHTWQLKSIWGITADEMEKPPTSTVTSIEKNIESASVFPNPIRRGQDLNLNFPGNIRFISLCDVIGRQYPIAQTTSSIRLPQTLNAGIYFLRIKTDNKVETIKLIVE
jgi:sucrose-6-phosphate hydrolase SacC (GH32 family)